MTRYSVTNEDGWVSDLDRLPEVGSAGELIAYDAYGTVERIYAPGTWTRVTSIIEGSFYG